MHELAGKKILYVITKSNWGGAQAYVQRLVQHFKDCGADVSVAYGGTGEANASYGVLAANLNQSGINGFFITGFMRDISLTKEFASLNQLRFVFRKIKPDIIHLNSSKAGGLGALAGRLEGVPKIVFTSHGLAYDENRSPLARFMIFVATWLTFILCHKVIVISKDTFERARRLPFCKNKIHLVYNSIPQVTFLPRDEARLKLAGNPINPAIPWIGTIAEFTKNKGSIYLIEAASILKNRGLPFRLVLIGVGEDLNAMKELAIKYGLYNAPGSNAYVTFANFRPDAPTLLKAFSIFVLPSLKEGLPTVLLEAGQAGCAVIGTRIPGITDVIDVDTGILIETKSPEAIADSIEELLKNPDFCERIGSNLQTKVNERFSIAKMFEQITKIYLPT